jgi:hypothetical protein
MYVDKIKSLKETIMSDTLKAKFAEIISKIKVYENDFKEELEADHQDSYNFKVLINEIFNYFYELSSSIFDTFVCEGGSEEYSYKSFKLFYMNIYYSYLKDFFIENTEIKNFFTKINQTQCQMIYAICEDSLFNFIAHYFFTSNAEYRSKIEHILNNIISYDCDTPEKTQRYKRILFTHYKESSCKEITQYIEKLTDKMKEIQRTNTKNYARIKGLKTVYYGYNKTNDEFKKKALPISLGLPEDTKVTRDDLKKYIDETKDFTLKLNNDLKELSKIHDLQNKKLNITSKMTQEEFEKGL